MENTQGTKRRGRPPKEPSDVKRHNVTVVMTGPMRDRIRDVAEVHGRSVSSEIDFRLGMSLALEDDTGSPAVRRLIDFTRLAAMKLQEDAGSEWTDDRNVALSIGAAVMEYIKRNSPPSQTETDWSAEASGLHERVKEANAIRADNPEGEAKMGDVIASILLEFGPFFEAQSETLKADFDTKRQAVEATTGIAQLFQIKRTGDTPPATAPSRSIEVKRYDGKAKPTEAGRKTA